MAKTALITGITGQDGSYLADLLLDKGYHVHGITRRVSTSNTQRLEHLLTGPEGPHPRLALHDGDLTDGTSLTRLLAHIRPDEIYNLGAQSHVAISFTTPEYTANATGLGPLRLLEALRTLGLDKTSRYVQASTSELFGKVQETPQRETTPFHPRSPYAAAKLYAYWMTVNYREAYGLHASNGILFNHESPRRGETFVTRKITRAVAAIHHGLQDRLTLGNLDACRDWGHARDVMEGLWRIAQHHSPDDFVLATGQTTSVRRFVELAFSMIGRTLEWRGSGLSEQGIDTATGDVLVEVDSRFFRPAEVDHLLGDATKARTVLGWSPRISLEDLAREMVLHDLAALAP